MDRDEVRSEGIDEVWAIVPNTSDKRIGFVRSFGDLNNRIVGMNEGIDDKVKSDYSEVRVKYPPLEIVLTPNLEMRGLLVINGDNWPVVTSVHQLSVWGDQRFS